VQLVEAHSTAAEVKIIPTAGKKFALTRGITRPKRAAPAKEKPISMPTKRIMPTQLNMNFPQVVDCCLPPDGSPSLRQD
jgi:hypothetical protein